MAATISVRITLAGMPQPAVVRISSAQSAGGRRCTASTTGDIQLRPEKRTRLPETVQSIQKHLLHESGKQFDPSFKTESLAEYAVGCWGCCPQVRAYFGPCVVVGSLFSALLTFQQRPLAADHRLRGLLIPMSVIMWYMCDGNADMIQGSRELDIVEADGTWRYKFRSEQTPETLLGLGSDELRGRTVPAETVNAVIDFLREHFRAVLDLPDMPEADAGAGAGSRGLAVVSPPPEPAPSPADPLCGLPENSDEEVSSDDAAVLPPPARKPHPVAESESESESGTESESESGAEASAASESESEAESESSAVSGTESESESESSAASGTESESSAASGTEAESDSEAESEAGTESSAASESEAESEADSEAESEAGTESSAASESEAESEAESSAAFESEAESGTESSEPSEVSEMSEPSESEASSPSESDASEVSSLSEFDVDSEPDVAPAAEPEPDVTPEPVPADTGPTVAELELALADPPAPVPEYMAETSFSLADMTEIPASDDEPAPPPLPKALPKKKPQARP